MQKERNERTSIRDWGKKDECHFKTFKNISQKKKEREREGIKRE